MIHLPSSETEVQDIVRWARQKGKRVRVFGAKHSVRDAYQCQDIRISLDRLTKIHTLDGDCIKVDAGIRLQDLARVLEAHGLAFPNLGGISVQSVAGFLSTGSDGGSLYYSLAQAVKSIRMVTGRGDILEIDRDHPWFCAAKVSLGLLGVITRVTFEGCHAYGVEGREVSCGLDDVIEGFPDWASQSDYARVLWYPGVDHCDVWRAQRGTRKQTCVGVKRMSPFLQHAANAFNYVGTRGGRLLARPFWKLFVSEIDRSFSGPWHEVLPQEEGLTFKRLPHTYCELWIPFECARTAIESLRDFFEENGIKSIPALPVELYSAPANDAWLSPGYGRDSMRVNFIHYDHDPIPAERMFQGPWRLLSRFDARAHWGKYQLRATPAREVTRNYPMWAEFMNVRKKCDPDSLFVTPYWKEVVGIDTRPREVGLHR